jgi:glycosyltransferase involved in cell wall biosynthesis
VSESAAKAAITLCMLTRNEEDRVAASLAAVREHVARMVVVDAESEDRTRDLAERAGAEVIVRSWEGFVVARRYLMSLAYTPWILMVDADEVVQPGLWAELAGLGFPECEAHGFQLRRRTVYQGRVLRRAFQPDWKTTLVRADRALFEDRAVHEALQVDGNVQRLRSEILHASFRSAEDQYRRLERYAELAARDLAAQGRRAGPVNLWLRPTWRWFVEAVVQGGFLDGPLGLTMAYRSAYGLHRRYRHLQRLQREA